MVACICCNYRKCRPTQTMLGNSPKVLDERQTMKLLHNGSVPCLIPRSGFAPDHRSQNLLELPAQVDFPEPTGGSKPSCAEQQPKRLDQPAGCSCPPHPHRCSLPSAHQPALQPGLHPHRPCVAPQAPAALCHASQQ